MALPIASSTTHTVDPASVMLVNGRVSAPGLGIWTPEERQRFREAMATHPTGPWSAIAALVGTRTVRQTMTHAQKCQQRIERHARGLKPSGRRRRTQSESSATSTSVSPTRLSSNTPGESDRSETTSTSDRGNPGDSDYLAVDDSALLDALTFDWVSAYRESPTWLEFEVSTEQENAP